MSDNNKGKKDPRDIERRPPELRSSRHPSSDKGKSRQSESKSKKVPASAKSDKRSVESKANNTKSGSDAQKKAAGSKSAQNSSKNTTKNPAAKNPARIDKLPAEFKGKSTKSNTTQKKQPDIKSAKNTEAKHIPAQKKKSGAVPINLRKNDADKTKTDPAVLKKKAKDIAAQKKADELVPVKLQKNNTKSSSAAKKKDAEQNKNNVELAEQDKRLQRQKKAILRKSRKREHALQCFNIAVIIAIFAGIALFINFGQRPTVDEDERRELAKIPSFTVDSYLNGSFTSGFSSWFNDAVPSRSDFKNFIALFRTSLGIKYDDGVTIIGPVPVIDNDKPDVPPNTFSSTKSTQSSVPADKSSKPQQSGSVSTSSATSTSTEKPVVDEPADVDGDMSGTVFVLGNGQGFSLFGGSYAGGQEYAGYVNELKSRLGGGVNVYSMVVPTSGSFYLPEKYKGYMASERDNIEYINSCLANVTPVDAYSALAAHSDEYIYFRTDHHWQQLGAYYAAEEFARVAGVPFAPLSSYTKQDREGMLGSLWGYSNNNPNMKKNPDTFTFYKPTNDFTVTVYDPDYTNPYSMPLILDDAHFSVNNSYMIYGGDMQINHVQTDCTNGRKLVIIGDSYDNALFLNLTSSFSEIWVVDMRANMSPPYFNLNIVDFVQKMGASDVLFCMDTFSAVGTNRNGLNVMLNNPKTLAD